MHRRSPRAWDVKYAAQTGLAPVRLWTWVSKYVRSVDE